MPKARCNFDYGTFYGEKYVPGEKSVWHKSYSTFREEIIAKSKKYAFDCPDHAFLLGKWNVKMLLGKV